jgi:putative membrane protein
MGPKVFDVPILLVLAYLGIGYCSWVLGLLILNNSPNRPLSGARVVAVPLLASFVMLAWDLSMEADWSTIDKAWIWRDGGAFYGVPVSNFLGWYATAYVYYQLFALSERSKQTILPLSSSYWRLPIIFYGTCAVGNLLILPKPMAPLYVTDASGKQWMTIDIVRTCALLSVFVMGALALCAWLRLWRSSSHLVSSPCFPRSHSDSSKSESELGD